MINLIWAMDLNNLIGKNNKIPWHYKEDLLYYKNKTEGNIVLMGEKTYYSLKEYYKTKALPYKKIYVASINKIEGSDFILVNDIKKFLENYDDKEDIWIVGGKTIYELSLPYASKLYITIVLETYDGDTYMNNLDLKEYKLISSELKQPLVFLEYERK
ncbi:MAG: dihydrofolate reductase [Acholeplasmatales bacterium]|jgi:dihydrofolate reductase|nr:dihydrofolate reductase [Acholeplasmatales bacterium]